MASGFVFRWTWDLRSLPNLRSVRWNEEVEDLRFTRQQFHRFKFVWRVAEICVSLVRRQRNSGNVAMQHRRACICDHGAGRDFTRPPPWYLRTPLNFFHIAISAHRCINCNRCIKRVVGSTSLVGRVWLPASEKVEP